MLKQLESFNGLSGEMANNDTIYVSSFVITF